MKKLQEGALKTDGTAYTVAEITEHNNFVDLVTSTAKEVTADMISKEDADKAINDAIEKVSSEMKAEYKKLYEVAVKQGTALATLKANNVTPLPSAQTFKASLEASIEANKEKIEAVVKQGGMRRNEAIDLTAKVAVNITEATTIIAGSTENSLTQNTGIISPIRHRMEKYLSAVTTGRIGTKFAMWIEETDEQGDPVFIAEATGKTQISVLYVEKTQPVQKIAVYSKVSTEMLADLPQLTSYIERSMMKRVSIAIETQLYSGTGLTVFLKGATEWATAFSAGNNANLIQFANEIDVINAVANQTELAYGIPNAILVHPDTIQVIKGLKSTAGEPLWKEYQDWSIAGGGTNLVIGGMRVIATPLVTSGDFLGGDMKVLNVLFREDLNIRLTPSGDDPINNLMTLIVESRLVQFVSANDAPCLIKGDFATAIAALTAPVIP